MSAEGRERTPTIYGRITHVGRVGTARVLRPVDADRDLARGRAQLLVQPAVRPDPHVLLGDLHLVRIICVYGVIRF